MMKTYTLRIVIRDKNIGTRASNPSTVIEVLETRDVSIQECVLQSGGVTESKVRLASRILDIAKGKEA